MIDRYLTDSELRSLVRRAGFSTQLLKRKIEEEIVALVNPVIEPSSDQWKTFYENNNLNHDDPQSLETWLAKHGFEREDLCLNILLEESLRLFKEQRYGPGVEEKFLERKNDLDIVIYSLLRVKDPGLARELWISLSEGEVTFANVASSYSDGPEAKTKGVIGPLELGR